MRVHMRGLGDCALLDADGNCVDMPVDPGVSDPTIYGTVGSTGAGAPIPVYQPPPTSSSNPIVTTQSSAAAAAQIAAAANQLLLTSQGRGIYTGPGGVQYIQPQGNASNVFAGTSTTGNLIASGSVGGVSTSTLMLLAIAAVAFMVISKSGGR